MDAVELPDDLAHAADLHVVVIGGGMAGLVAALQCAKVGLAVTVVEAADRLGGTVRSAELAGITLDTGAEGFSTRGGHVGALVDDVGLADEVVRPTAGPRWVAGLPGDAAAPLPDGAILGIPPNPFTPDVRAIIGWRGAWRAYADRLRPLLTIGQERSLGRLVRSRLGDRVADRLVAPVTAGVYTADADDIDVDVAAPGMNAALTRTGSLLGAVAVLRADRPDDDPGIAGLRGGMTRLVDALRERLELLGVRFRTGAAVERIAAEGDGWLVEVAATAGEAGADAARGTGGDAGNGGQHDTHLPADAVIVAADELEARRLLAPIVPGLSPASSVPPVEVVTLVLDAPALAATPRRGGVVTVPGSHAAAVVALQSARWEWVAQAAGGRHVVRVSFGAPGQAPATEGLDDGEAIALAVREASILLGASFGTEAVVAARRERFAHALPGSAIGHADATRTTRAAIADVRGLGAVGAWLAGAGLAQVVPDALEEGDRLRRALLWG